MDVSASATVPHPCSSFRQDPLQLGQQIPLARTIPLVKTEPPKLNPKMKTERNFLRHSAELTAGSMVSRRKNTPGTP